MKVYRSLSDIQLSKSSIAIGVFDGVHRGHQEVLHRASVAARAMSNGTSLTFTFDKHPAELIAPRHAPNYLSSLSQRIEMIERYSPTDGVLVVPFDLSFANLSAHNFVKTILVDRLGARMIFVGADFRYGKDRQGGVMDLQAAGDRYGFDVTVIHSIAHEGERVSSTRIRGLVAEGSIAAARDLLGHSFSIRGTVVTGKKLGRTIGFPTANILPEQTRQQLPISGVYAGIVRLSPNMFERVAWPSAISIGLNPTTDVGNLETKIECYIMDGFNADLYGQTVDVELITRLRPEQKFRDLDALVAQIKLDVQTVREVLSKEGN